MVTKKDKMKKLLFHSMEDWTGADSSSFYFKLNGMGKTADPEEADIIVFNGGTDIGTEMYREVPVMDRIPLLRSDRDKHEFEVFQEYKGSSKLLLGICRGSQFLNVCNGGSLWQHVDNHGRDHLIMDLITKETYMATSTHHQMMRPTPKASVIGVASVSRTRLASGVTDRPVPTTTLSLGQDIEIVWYKDTHSLCIQGHPEYHPGSPFSKYCMDLILKKQKECEIDQAA